jgi:hypothetical protein
VCGYVSFPRFAVQGSSVQAEYIWIGTYSIVNYSGMLRRELFSPHHRAA